MEDFVTFKISKKLKEKGFPLVDYIPTISQALKWLREEKEVDLVTKPSFLYDDNLNRIREYNCDIFAPQLNKPYHTHYYDSYELAVLAGIKYVLDNLI
jgi:hypothetical protein